MHAVEKQPASYIKSHVSRHNMYHSDERQMLFGLIFRSSMFHSACLPVFVVADTAYPVLSSLFHRALPSNHATPAQDNGSRLCASINRYVHVAREYVQVLPCLY